ncbi:ATPase, F1/V1/A1 complex, alpha/beta subunit [Tanacetum coccineum]
MVTDLDGKDNNGVASQEVSVDNRKVEEMKNDVRDREELNGVLYDDLFPPISSQLDNNGMNEVNNEGCLDQDTYGMNEECLGKESSRTKCGSSDSGGKDVGLKKDVNKNIDNKLEVIATEIDEEGNEVVLNVPMEAWSVKGISALVSSLGKPIIMNDMTAKMCVKGEGRLSFARVLIEVDARKELKKEIEVVYKGSKSHEKFTKKIQVEYVWKSPCCDVCKVFGHDNKGYRLNEIEENGNNKE